MPQFIISATGGNYTDATTWQGGVVPTSATSSDIIGLSFSGPLYFDATRTIGDLDLSQFENILGWTSSVTIQSWAGTFSLGPNMTWVGDDRTGTDTNSARLFLNPLSTRPTRVTTNGKKIKRIRFGLTPTNSKIIINDEISLEGDVVLDLDAGAGTTVNDYVVTSATAGVPAEIKIDPLNETTNCRMLWARVNCNLGWEGNIRIIGTGSGKVNNIGGASVNPGIPQNATFILEGQYDSGNSFLGMQNNSTFHLNGGTWSGWKNIVCWQFKCGSINNAPTSDYYIKAPAGYTFGIIDMRNTNTQNFNSVMRVHNLTGWKTRNIIATNLTATTFKRDFVVVGTASHITDLGSVYIPNMIGSANVPYVEQNLFFQGGFTYSFERFIHQGNTFDEFGPEATPQSIYSFTYSVIAATGVGNATIRLLRDENTVSGCDIRDIDFTDNTLYAFGSTFSNTTGVLTSYPTGGTGSGGGEVSYTFLS